MEYQVLQNTKMHELSLAEQEICNSKGKTKVNAECGYLSPKMQSYNLVKLLF